MKTSSSILSLLLGLLVLLSQSCAISTPDAASSESTQIQTKSPKHYKSDGDDLIKTAFPNVLSGYQNPITEVEDWEYYRY